MIPLNEQPLSFKRGGKDFKGAQQLKIQVLLISPASQSANLLVSKLQLAEQEGRIKVAAWMNNATSLVAARFHIKETAPAARLSLAIHGDNDRSLRVKLSSNCAKANLSQLLFGIGYSPSNEFSGLHPWDVSAEIVLKSPTRRAACTDIRYRSNGNFCEPFGIRRRVTKHLDEDRLREAVELRQGLSALGPERVGLIEDGGDAALFGEGRERNVEMSATIEI